jgi:hypothetical protein
MAEQSYETTKAFQELLDLLKEAERKFMEGPQALQAEADVVDGYRYERVTINGGQVRYEDDGSWTIVVSPRDPGVPNWVSPAGRRRGRIWFRWFLPAETPQPLEAQVVPIAELGG